MKRFLRNLSRSSWFHSAAGFVAAEWLRLVWLTNRFTFEPRDFYDRIVAPQMPVIVTFWHGQHLMTPFLKRSQDRAKVLISRHSDGEINARAAARLDVGNVRGSGDNGSEFRRKGGVGAFKEMLRTLNEGVNMALTADVPKRARVAGLGPIMLARASGRPILPFAIATSRFVRLDNWDGTTINLPFGRGVMVAGEMINVPRDADDAAMDALRVRLEAEMNAVTARAYASVGRADRPGSDRHG